MRLPVRALAPAIAASFVLALIQISPPYLNIFGSEPAFAKNDGSKGSRGKSGSRGGSSSKSSSGKSGNSSSKGSSSSTKRNSSNQNASSAKGSKTAKEATAAAGKPKAVVRQYANAAGLKQGDVASLLKSWNSLNRNEQAYLNNLDNLQSLPGKQMAYIRGTVAAEGALKDFTLAGGDPLNPPDPDQVAAAQATIDLSAAYAEYPIATLERQAELTATYPQLGVPTSLPPTDAELEAASTLIAQNDAWTAYQSAKTVADDAFLAASVSYGAGTDQATLTELRTAVDAIIDLKGLESLVTTSEAEPASVE